LYVKQAGKGINMKSVGKAIDRRYYRTRSAGGQSLLNIRPLYLTADSWLTLTPTKKLFKMDAFEKKSIYRKIAVRFYPEPQKSSG